MFSTIYVGVDNSEYSNQAIQSAVRFGQAYGATMIGCHVYAAQLHDYRFKQMEYTLPEEYLEEVELEKQRKIHDSLITMGLKLISDSYLDPMGATCEAAGLPFERKMMDGKHYVELLRDIEASASDLVVMGGLGLGKVRDSQVGSVVERVARSCDRDFLIVRKLPQAGAVEADTILVALDASQQSRRAVAIALELAGRFAKKVEVLTVDEGGCELMGTPLMAIDDHATEVELSVVRREGHAFQVILDRAREIQPWLVVASRNGDGSDVDVVELGSTASRLLVSCPVDLLLTAGTDRSALNAPPSLDLGASPRTSASGG
jgi:nucleotide-binding universal stress UspA family protein